MPNERNTPPGFGTASHETTTPAAADLGMPEPPPFAPVEPSDESMRSYREWQERSEADEAERAEAAEADKAAELARADEAPNDTSVADQWAVYRRADGSQYMICVADLSDVPEDQRPRTEPENDTDVRQAAKVNP